MIMQPENVYQDGGSSAPPVQNVHQSEVQANAGVTFIDPSPRVPAELKEVPHWVVWKHEERKGKNTKVPYNAKLGKRASSTDPATWTDYSTAVAALAKYEGLGCVIAAPYVGIDLDKCRDPENGMIESWAQVIIEEINSYSELSPSGRGFHIWIRGTLPEGRRRAGQVEMYDKDRYFTVTGDHLEGTPETINERDLRSLHSRLETLDPANRKPPRSVTSADTGASRFESLMAGRWEGLYKSQSEADLAFCIRLAKKHNCDPQKIESEFRRSGLYRDKWERQDYREGTLKKALEQITTPQSGIPQYEFQEARAGSGGSPPANAELDWRSSFKSYAQLEHGDLQFLIPGFLPDGITFVGGLPATGKTWLCLSVAKALITGQRFLGHYEVPTRVPVIYLIPEVGERAYRSRLDKLGLANVGDSLICRTMQDPRHTLSEPRLLAAVRALNPVVILDTVTRFSAAQDENSASDNRQLADGIFGLRKAGARGVIAVHHAVKASAKEKSLSLETTLCGTGDLAAIADAVWGLKCANEDRLEIELKCVKARDFEPPHQFHIMGRPYLNQLGDFVRVEQVRSESEDAEAKAFAEQVRKNPEATYREIAKAIQIPLKRVKEVAAKAGWSKTRRKRWESTVQKT
jgi:AAA domain